MDVFKLRDSLFAGIQKGTSIIVVDDEIERMVYFRVHDPEIENKSKSSSVVAFWTDKEEDIWLEGAIQSGKDYLEARGCEDFYFNIYENEALKAKIPTHILDKKSVYITAFKLS